MSRKWLHSINIKQHVSESVTNTAILSAATGIVQELNKLPESWLDITDKEYEPDLEDISDHLLSIAEDAKLGNPDEENDELADEFNYALDALYDWADYKRVWLGI